jgi:hypothetical protein
MSFPASLPCGKQLRRGADRDIRKIREQRAVRVELLDFGELDAGEAL